MSNSAKLHATTLSTLHQRRAGAILHPTSLPGKYEQGDLGPEAYRFVDFLNTCGLTVWQMLPVTPTHDDRSPYMGLSVDAGNPELISLELLNQWGWLEDDVLKEATTVSSKSYCIKQAYQGFLSQGDKEQQEELQKFIEENHSWLHDYAT